MRLFRRLAVALVGVAVMGVASSEAHANTIFVRFDGTTTGTAGTQFNYEARVGENGIEAQVQTGDFFTIYDFAGFIPGSNEQPADWAFVSLNLGLTPLDPGTPVVIPDDDPTLPNLTWSYTGTTPIEANAPLGDFSAESIYSETTLDDYASQDHENTGVGGTFVPAGHIGTTTVPLVPLPAAAWGGMALFGVLGGAKLRRSRRSSLV